MNKLLIIFGLFLIYNVTSYADTHRDLKQERKVAAINEPAKTKENIKNKQPFN